MKDIVINWFKGLWAEIQASRMSTDNESYIEINHTLPQPENTVNQLTSPPTPVLEANTASGTTPNATWAELGIAMRNFEGQELNPETGKPDPNWANCNPLNDKFNYGGYLPMYGQVRRSPDDFAIFRDMATGMLYGINEMRNKVAHHPLWTLLDLISDHAPVDDGNDPLHYAQVVGKEIGIAIDYKVINLI